MNIFSVIFGGMFGILGICVWLVAMMIILVGALGLLRVMINEVFEIDILPKIKNVHLRKLIGGKHETKNI